DGDAAVDDLGGDAEAAAARRVPQRVVEEVREDLPEGLGIDHHVRGFGRNGGLERHACAGRPIGEWGKGVLGGDGDVDYRGVRLPPARLDARQIEQVVHQALHAPGVVEDGL